VPGFLVITRLKPLGKRFILRVFLPRLYPTFLTFRELKIGETSVRPGNQELTTLRGTRLLGRYLAQHRTVRAPLYTSEIRNNHHVQEEGITHHVQEEGITHTEQEGITHHCTTGNTHHCTTGNNPPWCTTGNNPPWCTSGNNHHGYTRDEKNTPLLYPG